MKNLNLEIMIDKGVISGYDFAEVIDLDSNEKNHRIELHFADGTALTLNSYGTGKNVIGSGIFTDYQ